MNATFQIPAPQCAQCLRAVDSFTHATRTAGITFTARCHGQVQVVTVPHVLLNVAKTITVLPAFQPFQGYPDE